MIILNGVHLSSSKQQFLYINTYLLFLYKTISNSLFPVLILCKRGRYL